MFVSIDIAGADDGQACWYDEGFAAALMEPQRQVKWHRNKIIVARLRGEMTFSSMYEHWLGPNSPRSKAANVRAVEIAKCEVTGKIFDIQRIIEFV